MFAALFPPVYENKFKGVIDEFYVYNCSLTAQQIRVIADTCRDEGGETLFPFKIIDHCDIFPSDVLFCYQDDNFAKK